MNLATSEYPEDEDFSDFEPDQSCVLILGRSGAGKSTLVKSLLRDYEEFGKATVLLNDRSNDKTKFVRITWEQV